MQSTPTEASPHRNIDRTVWGELTAFQRDILRTLAELDHPNGLAIEAELKAAYPSLSHARVYQNLDALVEDSLITKRSVDKRQNAYTLTETGRTHLEAATHRYQQALQEDSQ